MWDLDNFLRSKKTQKGEKSFLLILKQHEETNILPSFFALIHVQFQFDFWQNQKEENTFFHL